MATHLPRRHGNCVSQTMKRNSNEQLKSPIILWLVLRVLSVGVAILAYVYDNGGWTGKSLRQLLLEPWYRYDVYYYVRIVSVGYQAGEITSGFHPLYPWLSTIAATIVRSPIAGLMLVST